MQKRLLGILASVAVIAAACGGATTSLGAAAGVGRARCSAAPAATPAPSGADLADEQILTIDLGSEPPTLDPNKAQDSTSIAVLHALHRGLRLLRQGPQGRARRSPSRCRRLGRRQDPDLHTCGRASTATATRSSPATSSTAGSALVDPRTAAPYAYVMARSPVRPTCSALPGADPAPTDADIDALLDNLGVTAPDDKTFVVNLDTPATYFPSVAGPVDHRPRSRRSGSPAPNATEAANYVSSGPFILDTWDHNSQIVLKPNPNWYGDASRP